jgi:Family of unknown function (DUF6474)
MALRKRGARELVPGEPKITPKKAKNALGVVKVIGPAVIPVIAPFAVRAFGEARERFDRLRARRLGVPVDEIAKYSGRGGALHARITGVSQAIEELRERPGATAEDRTFAETSHSTLEQLTAVVRAAERMPTARRKAAQRAVATELDELEQRLLTRLGI